MSKIYYAYIPSAGASERVSQKKIRQELKKQGMAQDYNIERIHRGETVKTDFAEYSLIPRGRVLQ